VTAPQARLDQLPAIEAAIWQQLAAAVGDKAHAWRTPVLSTLDKSDPHQPWPDARTVVLREVDVRQKQLFFYADERAAKIRQLVGTPQGTFVMWSRELGWQLRLRLQLSLEMSGLAATSRWAKLSLSPGAQDYLAPVPPGTPLPGPHEPPRAGSSDRAYFSVVCARVAAMDWLELHRDGHRRAFFNEGEAPRWVQP
jgi:pyridoxamine 5'-phosphate oxidase